MAPSKSLLCNSKVKYNPMARWFNIIFMINKPWDCEKSGQKGLKAVMWNFKIGHKEGF
jgi:hypothetical protein